MKRSKLLGRGIAVLTAVFVFSMPVAAQDDDGGPVSQGDDAKYLEVTYVKFKAGQRESAMGLITDHFMPAGEKAGLPGPIMAIHFQTGKWDAAFIWQMEGGMSDLEWYRSPNDVKWFAAMAEIEGSMEAAQAVWADYLSKVAGAQTEVGHHHVSE